MNLKKIKIGVISDVHSNYCAFKAVYEYLRSQEIKEYLLLGDYVSDTAETEKTMELLYQIMEENQVHILRGNREEYVLDQWKIQKGEKDGPLWLANSASGNLLYTYERLSQKDFEFFDSLPITFQLEKEGYPDITCCHGSPINTRELLEFYTVNTKEWLEKTDTDYLLCAHTHFPGKLEYKGKTYINNGCAGIAIDDYGFAQCTILHGVEKEGTKKWEPEFLKIPYDTEEVIQSIFHSGLYDMAHWFMNSNIQILKTGIDNSAKLVALAGRLQADQTGKEAVWPYIEEKYFEEAAGQLGVPDYQKCAVK
jgi:predicted phosphodiesterase